VAIIQRRGRGGSGSLGAVYAIDRECEDLAAVWDVTGGRYLFGHSFGGLVALRFARYRTDVDRLAVYEPGVCDHGSIPVDWIPRARAELARGDSFAAFLTFARGVNPTQTGRVPRALLKLIIRRAIPADKLRQNLALMPQCLREHEEVGRLDGRVADYSAINASTLLMRGTKGGSNVALEALASAIPDCETAALARLDHFGPEAAPDVVAPRLEAFFEQPHEVGN
jgi:pimeloyl-ACP methyl ester carboxylesterase